MVAVYSRSEGDFEQISIMPALQKNISFLCKGTLEVPTSLLAVVLNRNVPRPPATTVPAPVRSARAR
jgi:hypothetical protein